MSYERIYSAEGKPDFCLGHNPAVTITFVCPSKRGEEVTAVLVCVNWLVFNFCVNYLLFLLKAEGNRNPPGLQLVKSVGI